MSVENAVQIQVIADTAMVMLIWLVQTVIYPSFRSIEKNRFHQWHLNYMKTISRIVIPVMLVQGAAHGIHTVYEPTALNWTANAAILFAWGVTFSCSVPCHNTLQASGRVDVVIERLIKTNWLRTAAWSIPFLVHLTRGF